MGWPNSLGINKGNSRRSVSVCVCAVGCVTAREWSNRSYHTLFLFAQTLAIYLPLLLLRRDMLAIFASLSVRTCARMIVSLHVSVSVRLGGEHSCQTSPMVSPGTILCGLICEGQTQWTAWALCYSSVLISSAFRLYLDSFSFIGGRGSFVLSSLWLPNVLRDLSPERAGHFFLFFTSSFFSFFSPAKQWQL